jgi:aryl-alcohol dehydrogenase
VSAVLLSGKRIMGIVEGDSVPQLFIPQLVMPFLQGRFPFDKLVEYYPFEEINRAIADSEKGQRSGQSCGSRRDRPDVKSSC